MRNKIIIFAIFIATTSAFTACSGHEAKPGTDSTGHYVATNPYRDTFKTTDTYGDATTTDNSGSGGAGIVKPHAPQTAVAAVADSTKK
ncbi:MAG: hypothetical protein V4592_10570 [Bacteroidota bacterium]